MTIKYIHDMIFCKVNEINPYEVYSIISKQA